MVVIEKESSGEVIPPQDLIPEVRLRSRRRRLRVGLISLALVATTVTVASIAGLAFGGSNDSSASIAGAPSGTLLTSTALGKDTTVGDVQMFDGRTGYAVAFSFAAPKPRFYLVSTSDSAKTWRIISPLVGMGVNSGYSSPSIDFINPRVGYAYGDSANKVALTTNGGRTWQNLVIARESLDTTNVQFALSDDHVVVTSLRCTNTREAPNNCSTWLTLFHLATTSPYVSRRVPEFAGGVRWVNLLTAMNSSDIFVVPEIGGPIEESKNSGVTWSTMNTPCPREPTGSPGQQERPIQLTSFPKGPWLLDCFVDVGMNHGLNSLWSSSNDGVTWKELSFAGISSHQGSLMGNAVDFVWNNDHRTLFAMWSGAATGVGYSTDGRTWHWTLQDAETGGGQAFLAPVGSGGMLYSSPSDVLALTENGAAWHTVRAQPDVIARTPDGDSVMAAVAAKNYHYPIL